jgi:hypothetical protein
MPTNRKRIRPLRVNPVELWVLDWLNGKKTPSQQQLAGWLFFGDYIPGLPDAKSKEGQELIRRAGWPRG